MHYMLRLATQSIYRMVILMVDLRTDEVYAGAFQNVMSAINLTAQDINMSSTRDQMQILL